MIPIYSRASIWTFLTMWFQQSPSTYLQKYACVYDDEIRLKYTRSRIPEVTAAGCR